MEPGNPNARIIARARAAERRAQFLAELGRLFHSSLDISEVLEHLLAKSGEMLGEHNVVFLREGDELRLAAIHHPDPAVAERLRVLYSEWPPRLGESIVGRVAASGEPEWISDPSPDRLQDLVAPAYHTVLTELMMASFLAVPLVVAGRVIGTFSSISLNPERRFGPEDVELAQGIAEWAAAAIENARLYHELQQRLHKQTILYEASAALSSALSLDDVLHTLSRHLNLALDVNGVAISLWDLRHKDTATIYVNNGAGDAGQREGQADRLRRLCDYLTACRASEPQAATVIQADDPQVGPYESALLTGLGTQALLLVPLVVKGESLGMIGVYEGRWPRQFSIEEITLAQALAHQAAVAIENARLFESLQFAYNELQEASRLKDEFIQNVSHELRMPLTFIKGYVELLREETFGPLGSEAQRALTQVMDKTDAIVRLVERIVTLRRVSLQDLNLERLDLNELAVQAAERLRPAAQRAGIALQIELPATVVPVLGDRAKLAQVFDCLLDNAIKFSPNGGQTTLRIYDKPGVAWVEVTDTGIGIPRDKLDKVWDVFYQVDGNMNRRFGGAGVGLAVVKRVIQAHGGHVWADSAPGQGCTFSFLLHRASQEADKRG